MPLENSKRGRGNADDEGPMASALKRQRLDDRTCTEVCERNEFSHRDYTIGWICALPKEMTAAMAMLDIVHEELPRAANDINTYALGRIAGHNVVIVCLPSGYYGNNNAATVSSHMRRTFPSIRLCLMVGIGGGMPAKVDIRLGDVVVGEGVLQHDIGKTVNGGNLTRTGHVTRPPQELLTAVAKLRASHELRSSQIPRHLSEMLERHPTMTQYVYRDSLQDRLFESTYEHVESMEISPDNCELCNTFRMVQRSPRGNQNTKTHYGIIASGNQVVKHGTTRDDLAHKLNALCVDMEGAGVMDGFAGLVIRGICDYSDSHKNKEWQEVAAAVAAAYAKELLSAIPVHGDRIAPTIASPSTHVDFEWHIHVLQDLLRCALVQLGQAALTIFVDALDECADDQVEELVEYFESVGENAVLNGSQLNVCFSSRYYPHIDIQCGRKIDLEDQDGHEKDIAMYIRNKLKVGKSKTAEEVKAEIQTKAKGIFFWVVLVVDILKAEYKNGRIFDVKKRLTVLPAKLGDLFKEILLRDQKNLQDLQLCIQWILFSRRPLKLEEYYFAAVSGLNPDELREWDPEEVSTDDMSRFVTSSSKGLAETTKTKLKTVQFIHESVREFFLKDGLQQLWPNLAAANFESASHARLQQCCYSYFTRNTSDYVRLSLPKASSEGAKQLRATASRKFPFLEYATRHILSHADAAAHSISQYEFLARFPLEEWIIVDNIFETFEIRRHTLRASLQYVLAEKNLARLIETVLRRNPNINIKGERFRYPLFAALANGHRDAVKSLLQTETSRFDDDILAPLNYGSDFKLEKKRTPLLWAVAKGHEAVVRSLLEKSSDLKETDTSLSTPLLLAAENGHTDVVRLLLAKGCDIETENSSSDTPLLLAVENGHIDAVRLLIAKGSSAVFLQRALYAAAQHGHSAVVRILLDRGVHIDATNDSNMTPLLTASQSGNEAVVQLLLERGAHIEATNDFNMTPLLLASETGDEAVIRLLLESGASIEATSKSNMTPLLIASESDNEAVMRLLLESGASTEATDIFNMTPLLIASKRDNEAVVRLLLESGASTEATNVFKMTPLLIASERGNEAIARLLLDKGAAIETRLCEGGMTPLYYAALYGHEAVMQLLLDKGASPDIDFRGYGIKPLLAAVLEERAGAA
ncbi:hypothetical protein LLEC1_02182 [Akanthomyces lecanii]|uniref:Nucleoside phosphorylase domain-containing protein n=1 Tax=Cordyceps confragosa TaxID=2714763 RepID=A0A179I690_CORDF|nr:hypothetical protein LLEC1_02182 [Akanthomyces lecanii]